ncbi:hypothetical protein [Streptomyces sp. NPDC056707]|uniref:hypothetical protein n=1 Tax=unclassified Streptomyces TaxID=2593676 RepID=UPI0036885298
MPTFTATDCRITVHADLHCASGTSTTGHTFFGVPARTLLDLAPPAAGVSGGSASAERCG